MRFRHLAFLGFATFGSMLAACSGTDDHSAGDGYATTSSDEEALTKVCGQPTTGPVQGYDVSTYQGAFVWAGKGVQFGAARISDGTGSVDGQFDGNWARMKSAGVLRSAYQFFEPGESEVTQANMVIAKVGKLGDGDLPVMLDIEVTGGQSPATIKTKAQHWLDLVEAGTGKRPFVYSYGSFLETNLGSGFGKYPLWIANYGATCPSVPVGWTNWVVWQYSDGSGKLDHDVYNGSLAQLQALANGGGPVYPVLVHKNAIDINGDGYTDTCGRASDGITCGITAKGATAPTVVSGVVDSGSDAGLDAGDDAGSDASADAGSDAGDAGVVVNGCTTFSDQSAAAGTRVVQGPPGSAPLQYAPNCIEVQVGQTVTFQQHDFSEHPLEPAGGDTGGPIVLTNSGTTVTFTFTSAGTYGFECVFHPLMMNGAVKVIP